MVNSKENESTRVDCDQEPIIFAEVKLLQYKLTMAKIVEEVCKKIMYERTSFELKVFIQRNMKVEERQQIIVERLQGKILLWEQQKQKEESIKNLILQVEKYLTKKNQETTRNVVRNEGSYRLFRRIGFYICGKRGHSSKDRYVRKNLAREGKNKDYFKNKTFNLFIPSRQLKGCFNRR